MTPLSAVKLVETMQEADLPDDYIQVVTGEGEKLGPELVSSSYVRVVTFTGGIESGEKIARAAGLRKTAMELGSNCSVIVMDDASLDLAVSWIVDAGFNCQGQYCIRAQRILIHESGYEELVERLVQDARKLKIGNPLDESTEVGPMISESEAIRVERWVNDATHRGARLLVGGKRNGAIYMPAILEGSAPKRAYCPHPHLNNK